MHQFDEVVKKIIDKLLGLNLAEKKELTDEKNRNYYVIHTPNALINGFLCIIVSGHPEKVGVWSHTLLSMNKIQESSMEPFFQAFHHQNWGLLALNPHYIEDDLVGINYFNQLSEILAIVNPNTKLGFVSFSMGGRIIVEFLRRNENLIKRTVGLVLIDPIFNNFDDKDLLQSIKEKVFLIASEGQKSFGSIASIMFELPAAHIKGIHGEMPNKSLDKIIDFYKDKL